ncbi:MAG: DUF448 domain-containing protein [Bacilli bacterium]|jgi:predicted RNA-binding protein YlxR (DUF448 family)|nr:DUF448 domain-containing protein [Bacilli bacterium]
MKKPVLRFDSVNKVKAEKDSLLRIVLTPSGQVEVDPSGRINGHGVYMAPTVETLKKAQLSKALDKALGVEIPEEVFVKIGRYVK